MNTMFHLVSLLFFLVLVWLILRAQRDRDFILGLLLAQRRSSGRGRIEVAPPSVFLRRFAAALGIPFEGATSAQEAPVRVNAALFTELFLQSGLSLIRCTHSDGAAASPLLVELWTATAVTDTELAGRLRQALGGGVAVQLLPP